MGFLTFRYFRFFIIIGSLEPRKLAIRIKDTDTKPNNLYHEPRDVMDSISVLTHWFYPLALDHPNNRKNRIRFQMTLPQ